MASSKDSVVMALILSIRHTMAAPIPKIFSPEIGQLSFPELTQQTLRRILDLGFQRGIVCSLLVIACLVCSLISFLCALAACIDRKDTITAESQDYCDDTRRYSNNSSMSQNAALTYQFRPRTQNRLSKYIFSTPSASNLSPVTKITVHASSSHKSKTTPLSSPLRSALSKSSSTRLSTAQSFFFGKRKKPSPSSSPKSVRWADEIQVSVFTTVEVGLSNDLGLDEFDIGTINRSELARSSTNNMPGERDVLIKSRSCDSKTLAAPTSDFKIEGDTC